MKQLIMNILNKFPDNLNWGSTSAREGIADAIVDGINSGDIPIKKTAEGWYDKLEVSVEEDEERKKWICSLCGKSTFEVDWDYIGSGYNHLGCELEIEMKNDRRRKNSLQRKHEEKVFGGDTGIDADFHYGGDDIGDGHNSKQLHEDDWMEEDIFKMEDIPVILDNIREQEKREKENKK